MSQRTFSWRMPTATGGRAIAGVRTAEAGWFPVWAWGGVLSREATEVGSGEWAVGSRWTAREEARAPSVLRARARNPPPPVLRAEGGKVPVVCLHRTQCGGGRLQRRCKTEGVVLRFALETGRTEAREAFVVVDLGEEAVEAFPEREQVGAGVGVGEVRFEAGDGRACAGDLAGSQIDQEIGLAVAVEEGGGEDPAMGGISAEVANGFFACEGFEAHGDEIAEVRLQRPNRTEAPGDLQDDQPERFHGSEYIPARGAVDSGWLRPTGQRRRWLKSDGMIFHRPTVLVQLHPPLHRYSGSARAGTQGLFAQVVGALIRFPLSRE